MSAIYVDTGETIPYMPFADWPTGSVFVLGELVAFASQPLKANVPAALQLKGTVDVNADTPAMGQGALVYWDAGNSRATLTASTHKKLGNVAVDKALNATRVRVILHGAKP